MADILYSKIRDELKKQILSGKLAVGDKVPSIAELCKIYDISTISAKRVLKELEWAGYVKGIVGKGTFVCHAPMLHEIGGYYNLSDVIKHHGYTPSSKLLKFEKIPVTECNSFDAVGLKMFCGLSDEDLVYFLLIQRFRDDELIAIDYTYINSNYCPDITPEEVSGEQGLYDVIINKYKFDHLHSFERYFARTINDDEAIYLGAIPKTPAMKVLRITNNGDIPLVYNMRIYRGEVFELGADLGIRPY